MKVTVKSQSGLAPQIIIIIASVTIVLAVVLYVWVTNTMQAGGPGTSPAAVAIFGDGSEEVAVDFPGEEVSQPEGAVLSPSPGKQSPASTAIKDSTDGDRKTHNESRLRACESNSTIL